MESRGLRTQKATGKFAPVPETSIQGQSSKARKVTWKKKKAKHYKRISNDTRAEVIRRVVDNKETIAEVARKFKLCYTTVCSIIEIYKKEGRVEKIHQRQRKRKQKAEAKKEQEECIKQEFLIKQEFAIKSEETDYNNLKIEEYGQMKLEKDTSNRTTNISCSPDEWLKEEPPALEKSEISNQTDSLLMSGSPSLGMQSVPTNLQWSLPNILHNSPPLVNNAFNHPQLWSPPRYFNNPWRMSPQPTLPTLPTIWFGLDRPELLFQRQNPMQYVPPYFGAQNQNFYRY